MISQETIELVKAKAGIVEIIGSYVKLKKKGADYFGLCPFHNEKTPSFSVSKAKDIYKCFGCGRAGDAVRFVMEHERKSYPEAIMILAAKIGMQVETESKPKQYVLPAPRLEKLSAKSLAWFENDRKIGNNTLLRFGITESREWMPQFGQETGVICFNYYRDGKLATIKFRGPRKAFKMAKDAELIFYNLDAIKDEKEIVIVEGEVDCLSCHESGVFNSISVPNGAGAGNLRLEYLDNCWNEFGDKTKIILATDADQAGRNLRDELCRRLGMDRCYQVIYPEGCKDLNDVLVKFGRQAVKACVDNAILWPIKGLIAMDDIYPTVSAYYEDGYPKGFAARIPGFDELLTFWPGQFTVVTGIPGHGKDEFCNFVMSNLARYHGWPWGILGFEESAAETVTKLCEKYTGKAFGFRRDLGNRMNAKEVEWAIGEIDQHFFFINPDEIEMTIDAILTTATQLVVRRGIKGLYVNPWNWIEHSRPGNLTETEYISLALTKLIRWARKYSVHVILVAHTTKIARDKNGKYIVPNLYNISGSAHFFNKPDNGICTYRNYDTGITDVYVQKCKQSWFGQTGFASYNFNTLTRQYEYLSSSTIPVKSDQGSFVFSEGASRLPYADDGKELPF